MSWRPRASHWKAEVETWKNNVIKCDETRYFLFLEKKVSLLWIIVWKPNFIVKKLSRIAIKGSIDYQTIGAGGIQAGSFDSKTFLYEHLERQQTKHVKEHFYFAEYEHTHP